MVAMVAKSRRCKMLMRVFTYVLACQISWHMRNRELTGRRADHSCVRHLSVEDHVSRCGIQLMSRRCGEANNGDEPITAARSNDRQRCHTQHGRA